MPWPVVHCTHTCGLLSPQQMYRVAQLNIWYVSAFTWRNDLRQNAQTLFGCQCAKACPGATPYGLMALAEV